VEALTAILRERDLLMPNMEAIAEAGLRNAKETITAHG
jgi:hypothetical protein